MTTDRQKIIDFLTDNPDWVDAYRLVHPGSWIKLGWNDNLRPCVIGWYSRDPATIFGEFIDVDARRLVLPPSGEWRPKSEQFVLEIGKERPKGLTLRVPALRGPFSADEYYLDQFNGHAVRVTVEAIGDDQ